MILFLGRGGMLLLWGYIIFISKSLVWGFSDTCGLFLGGRINIIGIKGGWGTGSWCI